MIETVPGDGARVRLPLPTDVAAAFAQTRGALRSRAGLVWGEHCSECAYPACYSSCAFYTPRADLHCRRFIAGFEPLADSAGLHRVRFRKWGKLEAKGPAALKAADEIAGAETWSRRVRATVSAAPLPYWAKRSAAWRWTARREADVARGDTPRSDSHFVLETWAADGREHELTVTFLERDGVGMVQVPARATPTYSRLLIPAREIAARVPLDQPFLVQIEPVGEAEGREIVFGLADFAQLDLPIERNATSAMPAAGRPVKVVVWDLDETLWTGTLAESGPDGVTPRPEAVALVKALDERGVLQSIASKNDAAEALLALKRFGLADYFLHPQVHWGPKSGSLQRIAAALDLGLDGFIFIDDQPFERGEVEAGCPAVRTATHEQVARLAAHPWFDLPVTAESRRRRAMYQAEATRAAAFEDAGADYLAFLRGCDIRLDVRPLDGADVERVHELSQRTNQLNFRGTRFTRPEVEALVGGARLALTVRCADRFGDYGLIGFVVFDPSTGALEDFFMSCRVQRKRVERALFAHLAAIAREAGAGALTAVFRPTERNRASATLLADLGFSPVTGDEGAWARPADVSFADSDVARLIPAPMSRAA